ncbi:hypothetical protein BIY29_18420 [Brenneria alni]|uniref:Uncharacterized protein n=1 Tax=Brenneria alni TaxID=71656 RepID=A0A421DJ44_9GAMM|nr:hypothetical protein [Brenneria alni]RLM18314.1 hypothetical protein BIY29_18420 [Brenneria alni]
MKRKLRRRNQRWLSKQCRKAMLNDMPMDFFVSYPAQRADMNNASRLERRGKLLPDWSNAEFCSGHVMLPFVSQRGKIYHYQMITRQSDLPETYQSRWLDARLNEEEEPLDFQIIRHDLTRGTEEVMFDSVPQNKQTNELTNKLTP